MQYQSHRKFLILTSALTLFLAPGLSSATPTGGTVSSGTAAITNPSSTLTIINQSTPKAVINWTGFNTTKGQEVDFQDQQGSSSITLNRISGGATSFNGSLVSNGTVWLVNPQGILIGSTGTVNTAGFLATTSAITDSNFAAGKYNFTPGGGAAGAGVTNQGTITIADTGLAALVAPNVANSGTINFSGNVINAKAGAIALASGDTYTVDLAGDGLINLAASTAVTQQALNNTGTLNATSAGHYGNVAITAAQAAKVVDNVINLSGLVEAQNLTASGDTINYGAAFTPASNGSSVSLTAPGTITVASGSSIGATNNATSVNVSLDSTTTGNVNVNAATINTGGGTLNLTAEDPSNYANIQSVNLNSSTINTKGGNVTIIDNGEFTAQNGSINNAGTVAAGVGSNSSVSTSNAYGIYLNKFTIESDKGSINLTGYAPETPTGASTGVSISSSTINAENGSVYIGGLMGATTKGSSTGTYINASYIQDSNGAIDIYGIPSGLVGAKVVGGTADGLIITQSVIGGSATNQITLQGTGGVASGYASEGIVINNTSVEASGVSSASNITVTGTGGTGAQTDGVDATVGRANFELANITAGGSINITGTGGKSSGASEDAGVAFGGSTYSDIFSDNLSITGTGGSATNNVNGSGVLLATVQTQALNTTITGKGGSGTGTANYGIEFAGSDQFADMKSLKITGTGTGSAADVQADESQQPYLNNIVIDQGATYSLTGTRNSLNLKDLTVGYIISE